MIDMLIESFIAFWLLLTVPLTIIAWYFLKKIEFLKKWD
jgi:uncharacterized membrane-anchored protein YitT (DUF2179 family)